MHTYVELAKAEFRRYSTYRAATLAGIFTNSIFGFIRLGVLLAAIAAAGGSLGGYGPQEASTYVWLGQAFLAPVAMFAWGDLVAWSETWTSYPLCIVSLLLGISVSFLCRYGMNLLAFWTVDVQGFLNLYALVLGLLSGFYLPVHVFPGWLQAVAFASPFPAMFQAPIDVLSGRVVGAAAWRVIAGQVSWMIGLVILTRVVLWRATRRLVVQGG